MKTKKNLGADLNRYRLIFFQVGLILSLAITYFGINWTFSEKEFEELSLQNIEKLETEDIPITEMKSQTIPPPPPPTIPEIIEVVADELEVEETEIQSTETRLAEAVEEVIQVADIKEEVIEESIEEVPFVLIARVPVYPGCENLDSNEKKKQCMSDKIQELVKKEFDTNLGAELGLSGINRIFVVFKIDHTGNVTDIKIRGPHKALEKEAERVVRLIPRMSPGYQRNKPVGVIYTLPITFDVRSRS